MLGDGPLDMRMDPQVSLQTFSSSVRSFYSSERLDNSKIIAIYFRILHAKLVANYVSEKCRMATDKYCLML